MVFEILAQTFKEVTGELFNNINDFFSLLMIIIYTIIFFVLQYYIIKAYIYIGKRVYELIIFSESYFNKNRIQNKPEQEN